MRSPLPNHLQGGTLVRKGLGERRLLKALGRGSNNIACIYSDTSSILRNLSPSQPLVAEVKVWFPKPIMPHKGVSMRIGICSVPPNARRQVGVCLWSPHQEAHRLQEQSASWKPRGGHKGGAAYIGVPASIIHRFLGNHWGQKSWEEANEWELTELALISDFWRRKYLAHCLDSVVSILVIHVHRERRCCKFTHARFGCQCLEGGYRKLKCKCSSLDPCFLLLRRR